MSYTTGTVNTYADLVNTIRALGQAAGWITHRSDAGGWICSNADNSAHFSITVTTQPLGGNPLPGPADGVPVISVSAFGSYNASGGYFNQNEQDFNSGYGFARYTLARFGNNGPWVKYHAFVTGQYIHVVVEIATNTFAQIMIGQLDKDGAQYTGGSYNAATYYQNPPVNASSNSDGNGPTAFFVPTYPMSELSNPQLSVGRIKVGGVDNSGPASYGYFSTSDGNSQLQDEGKILGPWGQSMTADVGLSLSILSSHPYAGLLMGSANVIGNNTMMVPSAMFYVGAQGRLRYVGVVPDHAVCSMEFLAPGDIVTFGSDEWMCFPIYRKGSVSYDSTFNSGIAFRLRR